MNQENCKDSYKIDDLILRPFQKSDFDFLYSLHSNEQVAKSTIDGVQSPEKTQENLTEFIVHYQKYGFSQMAVFAEKTGEFIGRAGLTKRILNDEVGEQVEIRFAILPKFWGRGYASKITKGLIEFAFKNLDIYCLAASNSVLNQKSHHILTKNGFKFVKNIKAKGYDNAKDEIRFYLLKKK